MGTLSLSAISPSALSAKDSSNSFIPLLPAGFMSFEFSLVCTRRRTTA